MILMVWGRCGLRAGEQLALPPSKPAIQVFGIHEGLPNTTVHGIHMDRQGRLWVGTADGAATYNGRRWSPILFPGATLSKWVRVVYQSRDGAMWFGTDDGGLWRKVGESWTHFGPETIGSGRVNSILETQTPGRGPVLWVGTGAGLATLEGNQWRRLGTQDGLPDFWIWKILESKSKHGNSVLWVCTRRGLAALEAGVWRTYGTSDGLPALEVSDGVAWTDAGGENQMVVSCWGAGLATLQGGRWQALALPSGFRGGFNGRFIASLAVTPNPSGESTVWAGSFDEGLFSLQGKTWTHFGAADGLPSNAIYALLPNPGNRPALWIGTRGGGLASLDLAGWRTIDHESGLPSDDVTGFLEGHNAKGKPALLVGTANGIGAWDGRHWTLEGPGVGSIRSHVYSMVEDASGRLYMGSLSGVAVREGSSWSLITTKEGLPDIHVNVILPAHDGSGLYVGTIRGIAKVERRKATVVPTPPNLEGPSVYTMLETLGKDGIWTLWAGTRGDGLLKFAHGHWTIFGPETGLPSKSIHALLEAKDPSGRRWLWAGTSGAGLVRCDLDQEPCEWERLDQKTLPGLPSNTIASLRLDASKRILVGTKRGVVRITTRSDGFKLETFAVGDGLPSLSCNTSATLVDREGRAWIGTPRGAAVLDPGAEVPMPPLPPPYLDQIRVRGLPTELAPHSVLTHAENHLSFDFGISRFQREEGIRFRTQLEGLEEAPSPWTNEGSRDFAALPRGHYRLALWAQDHLGQVSGPTFFPFDVKASPWQTPLAYAVYAILGILAFFLIHRLRVRILRDQNRWLAAKIHESTSRLRQNKRDLERLNAELFQLNQEKNIFLGIAAHDLKSPLASLALDGEMLRDTPMDIEEVSRRGARIQAGAFRMSQLVSKLLDIHVLEAKRLDVNLAPVDLSEVVHELRLAYIGLAQAKAIRIELEVPDEGLQAEADFMYLREVLENLVSNAIKFTPPGPPERSLWIRVRREGGAAVLEVQDQGPGFTEEDKRQAFKSLVRLSAKPTAGESSTGMGLSIVKRLMEGMGATIQLISEPGQGCTFRLEFPLASERS